MQVPMLKRLTISNYKSIESAAIEFENPTYLVGQNGSGKSNITDAIAMLSEAMSSPLSAVFARRGGISSVRHRRPGPGKPPNFGVKVELERLDDEIESAQYSFEIRAAPGQGFEIANEECFVRRYSGAETSFQRISDIDFRCSIAGLSPRLDPHSLVLPIMGGEMRFKPVSDFLARMRVYKPDPIALAAPQDPADDVQLQPDGANIATTLSSIEQGSPAHDSIMEFLGAAVPGMTCVQSKPLGTKVSLEFTQGIEAKRALDLDAHEVSDGTLRLLALLVAIHQPSLASVLVFEEPEATIHPGALGVLFDAFDEVVCNAQMIVTTHSPDVLDQKWIRESNLRLVNWHRGRTVVGPISNGAAKSLNDRVAYAGELLRMNVLVPAGAVPMDDDGDVAGGNLR